MTKNLSEIIASNKELIFYQFVDKHILSFDKTNIEQKEKFTSQYQRIIDKLADIDCSEYDIIDEFEILVKINLEIKTPYIIAINEMHYLQNIILEVIIENSFQDELKILLQLFTKVNNMIANNYLDEYIKSLLSVNNIRINGMSEIMEKNIVIHYKAHLQWLSNLALSIQNKNRVTFPQLNSTLCDFGQWLGSEGKNIIHNNSKYKSIVSLHDSLHMFGEKIYNQLDSDNYHVSITYLEKCELISLNIGTELALIDNIIMNNQITKDSLTQALNRHALSQVFESQYELALATNNSFIVAMCDLDNFKNINDTYGHIAGDKMLIEFVNIVKTKIRNSDIIIRFGGEEFIILLPTIQYDRGLEVLESIRESFAGLKVDFEGELISTTVSIGMLEIKPKYYYKRNLLEDYISIVDKKLYRAKNNGKNQVFV
jgi:diguanylate cyclase